MKALRKGEEEQEFTAICARFITARAQAALLTLGEHHVLKDDLPGHVGKPAAAIEYTVFKLGFSHRSWA